MFRRRWVMAAVVAAAVGLVAAPTSQAGFSLNAVVGGSNATINDNNVPANTSVGSTNVSDINGSVGVIATPTVSNDPAVTGPIAGTLFTVGGVQIGVSASSNAGTATTSANLSTTTDLVVRNTTQSAITLTLTISDDFLNPAGIGLYTLSQTLTINAFYGNNSSTELPPITPTSNSVNSFAFASPNATSTGTLGSNATPFAGANNTLFNRTAASFNMGQTFTVVLAAGEGAKFQGTAQVVAAPAVPVPSGLVLLGTAVPVLGLLRRRLRRTEMTTV